MRDECEAQGLGCDLECIIPKLKNASGRGFLEELLAFESTDRDIRLYLCQFLDQTDSAKRTNDAQQPESFNRRGSEPGEIRLDLVN